MDQPDRKGGLEPRARIANRSNGPRAASGGAPGAPGAPGAGGDSGALKLGEFRVLNAIAEALNRSPDVEQALTSTLALVGELLGVQTGWVWLLDPETGQFYHAAHHNLPPFLQAPTQMAGDWCTCISEFEAGQLAPKNIDVLECSRLRRSIRAHAEDQTEGLRFHASIPLYFHNKPLGIMNLAGPSWRRLTSHELELLTMIAHQVGIAIERARLAEAAAHVARVEERTRMAREIHDTLAQGLTAIALHVEGALPHLESNPQRARARLEQALVTTRENLEEARRCVRDLRAVPLAGKTLEQALRALARSFRSETGIRAQVQTSGTRSLPLRVEAEFFRIAQEALANVRKHANATQVDITLRSGPRRVSMSVADDGQGFDPKESGEHSGDSSQGGHAGQGLVGIRERAALLNGRARIVSAPGRGVRLSISVPLTGASASAPALETRA